MGKEWPAGIQGKNLATIVSEFNKDNTELFLKQETEALLSVTKLIGREIPVYEAVAGDFVLVQSSKGHLFAAIYAGNNQIMASFQPVGVKVVSCSNDYKIIAARRID
jgi:hypothetical protein